MNKPIVGITMGDPAGSGPEITIKALADPEQYTYCRPIVVGDVKVFEQARKFVGREDIVIHRCDRVSDALFTPGTIDVLHLDLIEDINKFEMAKVSVEGGNAAFQCVKKVIELAMAGEVDATCTNALNKEAMNKALEYYHGEKSDGYTHFDGHTEIYATYTHTKKYTMMLAHHDLRVVHVSTHVSLREACDRVKKERVLEVIEIANKACKDMGIENPRIAVAGLNPHCGENGLFGREEIEAWLNEHPNYTGNYDTCNIVKAALTGFTKSEEHCMEMFMSAGRNENLPAMGQAVPENTDLGPEYPSLVALNPGFRDTGKFWNEL